jgi:hypothetical protein
LTSGLAALAGGLAAVFYHLGREPHLETRVPEFIGFSLLAGVLYLIGVYEVEKFPLGGVALAVILGGAVLFRALILSAPPALSDDVYRYQWEGRVVRAGFNPYTVYPARPELAWVEDPAHPIRSGSTTPSLYPPLSEQVFAWFESAAGYKRLFLALDLASLAMLLLLLSVLKQPLHRALIYAWNPTVVVAFAMEGHHDSLAIVTLLAANLFIIVHRPVLSITALALSVLFKYFPALLLPVFLKRSRPVSAGIFAALIAVAYLPYLGARRALFQGLGDYARGWEANDSLFRLIRLAGNSKPQAELVAAVLVLGLVVYALQNGLGPLRASLVVTAGLVLVSPNAFPWYFTWSIPFLCFYPSPAWLLMSVTSVLGYAPVAAYAAGQPYRDSPFILWFEYAPALAWLGFAAWQRVKRDSQTAGSDEISQ